MISKKIIDKLHEMKCRVSGMEKDNMRNDQDMVDSLITKAENNVELLFDYPIVGKNLNYDDIQAVFTRGKMKGGLAYYLATAMERRWLMTLPTKSKYETLNIPVELKNDQKFMLSVGVTIWEKFERLGEEDFVKLMMSILREQSTDEIMWAKSIYLLQKNPSVGTTPFWGVFDDLLRTYESKFTPSEAVTFLKSSEFEKLYQDVEMDGDVGMKIRDKLLEQSPDELMWAKLIYMLQPDQRKFDGIPLVFDSLLRPHEAYENKVGQYTPSASVRYLTSSEMYNWYFTAFESGQYKLSPDIEKPFYKEYVKSLQGTINDHVMLAKVLHILRNDGKMSSFYSGLLKYLLDSWTKKMRIINGQDELNTVGVGMISDEAFTHLFQYAQFTSGNPDVFMLKKLEEVWTDEVTLASILNKLRSDKSVSNIALGVLDALFHSWVSKSYNSIATAGKPRILIEAYDLIQRNNPTDLTYLDISRLLKKLQKWSTNDFMWAKFLYKLRQDHNVSAKVNMMFDTLLQPAGDFLHSEEFTPSYLVRSLTSAQEQSLNNELEMTDFEWGVQVEESRNTELWTAKVLYLMLKSEDIRLNWCFPAG
ncbi:hypothetical protein Plhal304r1_c029g0094771 [Plasmopara halstedii]